MILTGKEIYQIQFVLPVQDNLKNLELSAQIFNKINIKEELLNDEKEIEIEFSSDEIIFLREMITFLDQTKKLNIQGLSLYNKILNIKE